MSSLIQNIQARFEALFEKEPDGLPWIRRFALRSGRVAYLFGRKFHQDLALERAAALAFAATISVIPLGVIVFMLFHNFGQFDAKVQELTQALVDSFVPAASPDGEPLPNGSERREVLDWVNGFLARLRAPLQRSGAVTPLALIGLVIAASSLFRTMERSFSAVWNVGVNRGYFRRIATYWLMLTAIPIFLGLSFVPDFLDQTASPLFDTIRRAVLPVVVAFFGFVVLFTQLPNARVRVNAAAGGALIASVVWVFGTQLFTHYIQHWANRSVYGALGVIPFFLVWIYYSWLVALNGCQIAYCLQNYRVLSREVRDHVVRWRVARPVHAIVAMERIYRGFSGEASVPTSDEIAEEFQTPLSEVEELLEALRNADLIVAGEGGRFLPTQAPSRLSLLSVASVFPTGSGFKLPMGISAAGTRVVEVIRSLGSEIETKLGQLSFADIPEEVQIEHFTDGVEAGVQKE